MESIKIHQNRFYFSIIHQISLIYKLRRVILSNFRAICIKCLMNDEIQFFRSHNKLAQTYLQIALLLCTLSAL